MNDVFKALSDPTRRKILELLKQREMSAGEIASYFQISKPSISHHLAILTSCELVIDQREGQSIIYRLNMTVFQEAVKWIFDFCRKEEASHESEDAAFDSDVGPADPTLR